MSDRIYVPKAGSIAARLIEHLQQAEPGTALTSAEISQQLGVEISSVAATLATAVMRGALVVTRAGRSNAYALPGEPAERTDEDLQIQAYSDGDIVFEGGVVGDDGRVMLSHKQAGQLVAFLTTPAIRLPTAAGA